MLSFGFWGKVFVQIKSTTLEANSKCRGKVLSTNQPKNDDVLIQKLTDNDEFKSSSASTKTGD
jgi:hypothetical protein